MSASTTTDVLLCVEGEGGLASSMKDGSVHEGEILSETEKTLVIDTTDLGPLPLTKALVEKIEKEGEEGKEEEKKLTLEGLAEMSADELQQLRALGYVQ